MQKPEYSNHLRMSFNNTLFYSKSTRNNNDYKIDYEFNDYSIITKHPWVYWNLKKIPVYKTSCWKIHVSSSYQYRHDILKCMFDYCTQNKLPFKYLANDEQFIFFNGKEVSRMSFGKFFVVYVLESQNLERILEELNVLLLPFEGPYILTDRQYKNNTNLYYRFGEYLPIPILNEQGVINSIVLKENTLDFYEDKRVPYYKVPDHIYDPISYINKHEKSLLLSKYEIVKPLHFSASGGVYLMSEKISMKKVVVKEARFLSGLDKELSYATDRLKNEYLLLNKFKENGIVPFPMEYIKDYGNEYLVEEYIDGVTLREFIFEHNPLMRPRSTEQKIDEYFKKIDILLQNIQSIVDLIHVEGFNIKDLSYNNFMVELKDLSVKMIDLEYVRSQTERGFNVFTPGFNIREEDNVDEKKLIRLILATIFPNLPLLDNFPEKIGILVKFYVTNLWNKSKYLNQILTDLLDKLEMNKNSINTNINLNKFNDTKYLCKWINTNCTGIHKTYRTTEDGVFFPADPHVYNTNPLSLAHGFFGILYGLEVVSDGFDNALIDFLKYLKTEAISEIFYRIQNNGYNLPPGLYMGYSGVVFVLLELGKYDLAKFLFDEKIYGKILDDNSMFYGNAGIIIATLKMMIKKPEQKYENYLKNIADIIIRDLSDNKKNGFGEGTAGMILSLIYLYRFFNDESLLDLLKTSIEFEIDKFEWIDGVISIRRYSTEESNVYSPYIYDGISGVGLVLLRYYLITYDRNIKELLYQIIESCDYDLTLFPGYMRGISGIISFLTDCTLVFFGTSLQVEAERIAEKLIKSISLFEVEYNNDVYFLGEQLFKCSQDYATGTIGIVMQIKRFYEVKNGKIILNPNFLCDELLEQQILQERGKKHNEKI